MLDYQDIGRRIEHCREQQGLSGKSFAEKIGISENYLAAIEHGNSGMLSENLELVCDIALSLQITIDYLLLGK